jgi:TetR/AcrR family transcriptional regulator
MGTLFFNLCSKWNKKYPKAQSASCCPLDVFSLYGFSGASLDEIAQLADMHKSNIFYYYENKESLYVEVLTTVLQNGLLPYKP